MTETAILGGGCFWCVEAVLVSINGVLSVQSGYAGGKTENPTYKEVCSGLTGHAEVVEVIFDPAVISYAQLLRIFFTLHDPTTLNRQGNDRGTQYRSVIFWTSEEQRETAETVRQEIEQSGLWSAPLVTQIEPLSKFWPAEAEHDDYFRRNPDNGYCQVVVAPKVVKMRKVFAGLQKASNYI
ncbi:methionine sulfoxide reductase A [Acetobacter aceti NRIC 0242]|uniref:Peptide methionine sulfoxide reductase MsrA n=1 Tax=Acetobacter aceti NBRC 14818 TaxID=887700 RepID=A0AB33IAZ1_ACEAC|nr:peptide-methionine (S)-S-oxide reductase MsrA [Acetobacter aceti]TCS34855.1 peptide-methionine (S)-S-oxide reductase [Acetobacter aceti NBRC 14818]BCK74567.1 peptide methionine sulfoxide reductase MsrA [Acetobacter aceti NBRC 14818]GAN56076.1 methionine sulfoxide reductase A [Acetobacter aceti NBRC 14818]GBO81827.1 methionine sulfoxide reductase A [Acetobacter aceti NRIC 0242]